MNGLTTAGNEKDSILGPSGEQVTEVGQDTDGSLWWQRTYVYAGAALFATYDPATDTPSQPLPSFRLTDWLGTLRASTDAYGSLQSTCNGLPYGNGAACGGNTPDPRYFTGKERDLESNNDYFGARYYESLDGRFLTPDWSAKVEPVPYAKLDNPQSLNLYAYVGNNPLSGVDPDGHFNLFSGLAALWGAITGNEGGKNQPGIEEFAAANSGGAQQQAPNPQDKKSKITAKAVISGHPTPAANGASNYYHYQIENAAGKKLKGNGYATEEHIKVLVVEGNVQIPNQTSEGTFVPSPGGVITDRVGLTAPLPAADWYFQMAVQTFTVSYQGQNYDLTTQFVHLTKATDGQVPLAAVGVGANQ